MHRHSYRHPLYYQVNIHGPVKTREVNSEWGQKRDFRKACLITNEFCCKNDLELGEIKIYFKDKL